MFWPLWPGENPTRNWGWQSCDTQVPELSTDLGLPVVSPLTLLRLCHPNPTVPKYTQFPTKTTSCLCSAHASTGTTPYQAGFSAGAYLS